jgi:hypothetical protein
MSEPKGPLRPGQPDLPFATAYVALLAIQVPVWLCAGLAWGAFMMALEGLHPFSALVAGVQFGACMWVLLGNLLAVGLAWRRSGELPAADREAFRSALERAARKLRLIVLAESEDEVVLGPKWALVRFRLQEVRVEFRGHTAVLSAPAPSLGVVRKALRRALEEAPAGARQASQG